ncbi:hypothetical protein BESB_083730 [Besnoitia besnoiti]|uniref:Transmembrane protein n=1 Tax=Besnoitia besnoiti TaxID=94643 RepID=A0A2A9M7L7_BESBE|nr:hypothetical protein BESB_083730 [Besnoitia besnoiti]PFH33174.1 hypothetical protein BESB_083730 [Besnoitia besnoiti]
MGKCAPAGGFENPAYGAWGIGVTLQLTVALIMLLLGLGHHGGPSLLRDGDVASDKPADEYNIRFVTRPFFDVTGGLHAAFGILIGTLAALGYLVSSCFLCPLAVVAMLNNVLLLLTTCFGGYMMTGVGSFQRTSLNNLRDEVEEVKPVNYSETLAYHNQGMIMYFSVISLAVLVPYNAALSYSVGKTSGAVGTAYLFCLTIIAVASSLIFYITAMPQISAIGAIWLIGLAFLGIILKCQERCCFRVLAVLSGIVFAVAAVFSVITMGVSAKFFTQSRKYLILWGQATEADNLVEFIRSLSDSEYRWLKATFVSYTGIYYIIEAALSCSIFVFSIFSMAYALYSAILKKPPPRPERPEAESEPSEQQESKA